MATTAGDPVSGVGWLVGWLVRLVRLLQTNYGLWERDAVKLATKEKSLFFCRSHVQLVPFLMTNASLSLGML